MAEVLPEQVEAAALQTNLSFKVISRVIRRVTSGHLPGWPAAPQTFTALGIRNGIIIFQSSVLYYRLTDHIHRCDVPIAT